MDSDETKATRAHRLARLAELERLAKSAGTTAPKVQAPVPAPREVFERSRVPAPLEPIRGSASLDRTKAPPIRWPAWQIRRDVELWQAVALSMNIPPADPLREKVRRGASGHSRLPLEFFERLDLCQQCVRMDGPIRPQGPLYRGMLQDRLCHVLLAEVADVLAGARFELPEEMRALLLEPAKLEAQAAALVVRTPAAAEQVPAVVAGTPKTWTPERLEELRAYRGMHGTKKAAAQFGVAESRVRALLPGDKPAPKGFSAFNPRMK